LQRRCTGDGAMAALVTLLIAYVAWVLLADSSAAYENLV
jgi:hypothetical protein